ncbi:hypothetical protein ASPVEDRAFT_50688 [Aspergillus versicolor CBS 583.65]|uniref:Altered inheritance of mitochondria protein 6 n=1 Tax=Aspergillus versicolor CBS 583.65 TaxID=1036611 RepID=A0A1L9PCA2_ASPVE|nr:uncharacterized protein ASPVEDRAFT_50688 [Aspergillus versicolor CBS 583.65]OJI99148.1 hypothetical protein ASPVEDRAFT_50688 [Aspergillus versicolor CBS 583.65]
MSSSSPRHPQSRLTTPFPAAACNELHTVGGTSHGDETSNTGNRPDNKPATFGRVGVPEELVYDSDLEEASERPQWQRKGSLWSRGLAAVSPLFASSNERNKTSVASAPLLPFDGNRSKLHPRWLKKPTRSCCFLYCLVGFLAMLGVFQFISIACGIVISFFPDEIDRVTDHWRQPQRLDPADTAHWPTDISKDIIPVPCHSHNDYWRRVPLYSALEAGCIGVEADVWLFDDELYVGHSISALTSSRTLRSMYIDPLVKILRRQNPITQFHHDLDQPRNGVFDRNPSQQVILLIDFKTDGEETWDYVHSQLNPLRESGYLTHYNGSDIISGPITVVGTGNTPFSRVVESSTYRDIFFDAPLDRLVDDIDHIEAGTRVDDDTFNITNSYYASISFHKAVGTPWLLHLTDRQVQTIRSHVRAAHRQGLKVRYWGTPNWPRSLRNHVWRVLTREGVDMLNVDDLVSATRKDWAPRISDWWHWN